MWWFVFWLGMVVGAFSESFRTGVWVLGSGMFTLFWVLSCETPRGPDRDEYARSTSR